MTADPITADDAALLAAIRATPDDDVPRLVYADWLDERAGEDDCGCEGGAVDSGGTTPWGEPVEVACGRCGGSGTLPNGYAERADMIRTAIAPTNLALTDEVGVIAWRLVSGSVPAPHLSAYYAALADLSADDWPVGCGVTCRRGFIEAVTCPADAWLAHGDAILARHPVREVTLTTVPDYRVSQFGSEFLRHADRVVIGPLGAPVIDCEVPIRGGVSREPAALVTAVLSYRWPGVRFTLPEVVSVPETAVRAMAAAMAALGQAAAGAARAMVPVLVEAGRGCDPPAAAMVTIAAEAEDDDPPGP